MRWFTTIVCVAGLAAGCQSQRSKLIAGGVASTVAIVSTYSIATREGEVPVLLTATAITSGLFGLLALLSGLDHDSAAERPRPVVIPLPDHREEAWQYTKVAQVAARTGDCDAVLAYQRVVLELEADFYHRVFMRDAAIERCLRDPSARPPAPPQRPPEEPRPAEPAPRERAPEPALPSPASRALPPS